MIRSMKTAPQDESEIVILTSVSAHLSQWDEVFLNFWSLTADRVIHSDEALGWMKKAEWREFALRVAEKAS